MICFEQKDVYGHFSLKLSIEWSWIMDNVKPGFYSSASFLSQCLKSFKVFMSSRRRRSRVKLGLHMLHRYHMFHFYKVHMITIKCVVLGYSWSRLLYVLVISESVFMLGTGTLITRPKTAVHTLRAFEWRKTNELGLYQLLVWWLDNCIPPDLALIESVCYN